VLGQVLDHRPRHIERVLQEQPDVPHRAHLEGEAQLMVLRTPQRDQSRVGRPEDVADVAAFLASMRAG
jgi:NAD(P)-dependent dehydrogenase (short-subunit alcohol dehydrogenase family)